jgi:hypothetical protein
MRKRKTIRKKGGKAKKNMKKDVDEKEAQRMRSTSKRN